MIELQCNGQPIHNVLDVKEAEQTFVFENVNEQPVPSLLREFSAPVKLEYNWRRRGANLPDGKCSQRFPSLGCWAMLLAKYIRVAT